LAFSGPEQTPSPHGLVDLPGAGVCVAPLPPGRLQAEMKNIRRTRKHFFMTTLLEFVLRKHCGIPIIALPDRDCSTPMDKNLTYL